MLDKKEKGCEKLCRLGGAKQRLNKKLLNFLPKKKKKETAKLVQMGKKHPLFIWVLFFFFSFFFCI